MSSVSPTDVQLASLLARYSPEQIVLYVDAAVAMQSLTVKIADAPAVQASQSKKRSKKITASKDAPKIVDAFATPLGYVMPSRPLNSWMAFRSYYSPIFRTHQQKNISGLVTVLWAEDPFKAKWCILAKAYSMIRAHFSKNMAPLNKFLASTCPHIGIISMDEYLAVMGWEIVQENGEMRMVSHGKPDVASFPEHILVTNLSAEDVVAFCVYIGYIPDPKSTPVSNPAATTLTMAAQPPVINHATLASMVTPVPPSQQHPRDLTPYDAIQEILRHNNDGAAGASSDLRQLVHDLSGEQYPFYGQFDPHAVQLPVFNPFDGDRDVAYSTSSLGTYLAPSDTEFPETFDVDSFLANEIFNQNK